MLIVGMFVSFTAAMLAMLFFTETVKTPEELEQMILGEVDNTRLSDDFTDPEDKLGVLIKEAASYRQQYETQLRDAEDFRDSLNTEVARLQTDKAAFDLAQQVARGAGDSARQAQRKKGLDALATFYNKIKAPAAAEIFQSGALDDTTVAMIMHRLQPQLMAKILANLTPENAADVTKLMRDLNPE